jgi:hypothetical protein
MITDTEHGCASAEAGRIVFKASSIHGLGGFAAADIPAGTRVVEYIGRKITKPESLRRCQLNNQYIFALDEKYDLDGDVSWNPARFINHCCAPNCEAVLEGGRIWIVALRDARAGDEVTFNYGYDLEDYRQHSCHCGAPGCVGFIVAEECFQQVRRSIKNVTDWNTTG